MTKKSQKTRSEKDENKTRKRDWRKNSLFGLKFLIAGIAIGEWGGPLGRAPWLRLFRKVSRLQITIFHDQFCWIKWITNPNLEPETECFLRQNLE